jgi:hypothetical protein
MDEMRWWIMWSAMARGVPPAIAHPQVTCRHEGSAARDEKG